MQDRRLACTVRADEGDQFSVVDGDGDALDGVNCAIVNLNVFNL